MNTPMQTYRHKFPAKPARRGIKPTHTENAIRFHGIEVDDFGAKAIWIGVHVERYATVADACAAVEARNV